MITEYSWLLRNLVYSTSVRFAVPRGKAATTGIFRRMQVSFVINLHCFGTRKMRHSVYSVRDKLSLVLSDVNRVYYKEIILAFGKAVTEGYTSGKETVFIREYWAPLAVSFYESLGFLCIHITFSVDLKQLSHKRVVISRRSFMSPCFICLAVID